MSLLLIILLAACSRVIGMQLEKPPVSSAMFQTSIDSPTSQPTTSPTCPTSQPTGQPTKMPSHPSSQPSSTPTLFTGICPNGYKYTYDEQGDDGCIGCLCIKCDVGQFGSGTSPQCRNASAGYYAPDGSATEFQCPAGTYSFAKQSSCSVVPAGGYAPAGSFYYSFCPPNTYSLKGSGSCTHCPSGMISPAFSGTASSCVAPTNSFGISFLGLFLSIVGFYVYILGGRLHRMAFKRREVLIRKCALMYNTLCEIALKLRDQFRINARNTICEKLNYWVRLFLVIFIAIIVFLMFFLVLVYQTFYTCVIVYRGYVHLPNVDLPPIVSRFQLYVDTMEYFSISAIQYLAYPFKYALSFVSNLSIDFNGAKVTCVGAQIPMQLLANFVVIGIVVLVIESDMEIFWCSAFANAHQEFRKLLVRQGLWKHREWTIFCHVMWSFALQIIPHPRSLLQFVIGFFTLVPFFDSNYHAKHTGYCNTSVFQIDTILSLAGTAVAYFALFPFLYIFSQILVPNFVLDKGVVRTKRFIQKRLWADGDKCICGLPLIRHHSRTFKGDFTCSNGLNCCSKISVVNTRTFYGCPRFAKCDWKLCVPCGNTSEVGVNTLEYAQALADGTASAKSASIDASLSSRKVPLTKSNTMNPAEIAIVMTAKSIAEKKNERRLVTTLLRYGKMIGSGVALDWLYLRCAYSFAVSLIPTLDPTKELNVDLSWLAGYRDHSDEYEDICLELQWTMLSETSPTYLRMIRTVQYDLTSVLHTGISCSSCAEEIQDRWYYRNEDGNLHLCKVCEATHDDDTHQLELQRIPRTWLSFHELVWLRFVSYIPVGQLLSERGRIIWYQVIRNYVSFIKVSLGWWGSNEYKFYGLAERFEKLFSTNAVLTHKNIFEPTPIQDEATKQDENLKVMSAVVSSRLVLIQLIPYLTLFSAFAVNVCSCPVLLREKDLVASFPPLFVRENLIQLAKDALVDVGIQPTWHVKPMCVYLFITRSRGIQYLLNVLTTLIVVVIVFSHNVATVTAVMILSLSVIAIQGLICSIFPVIMLHNLLFPTEKVCYDAVVTSEDKDDADKDKAVVFEGVVVHTLEEVCSESQEIVCDHGFEMSDIYEPKENERDVVENFSQASVC